MSKVTEHVEVKVSEPYELIGGSRMRSLGTRRSYTARYHGHDLVHASKAENATVIRTIAAHEGVRAKITYIRA